MSLTLDEAVEVLVAARADQRRRRSHNVYVSEPRWVPRDPTAPHPYEPRRYSNGFDIHVSDACWCDGLESRAVHGAVA